MTDDNDILEWIRFAKGDVPGHEFHGNQYQQGHDLYERSGNALRAAPAAAEGDKASQLEMAHTHAQLAHDYMSARDSVDPSKDFQGQLAHRYELTAKAHNSAAKAWQALYDGKGVQSKAVQASQRASSSALQGAYDAQGIDDVYEANPLIKGDVPGHDFHGNQYSSGGGTSRIGVAGRFESGTRYTPDSLRNVTGDSVKSYGIPVTDTAAKLMHITDDQVEWDKPNGLGQSKSDEFDAKVAAAIPSWLSSKVTQSDRDALTDQNYHMTNRALDLASNGPVFTHSPGTQGVEMNP